MAAPPVFLCGSSRSGTALLQSALNLHPEIHIGGETHYFDDLRVRLGQGAAGSIPGGQVRMAQDALLAIGHRPYGHGGDPDAGRVERARLISLAERVSGDRPPSGDAYFEAYCALEATHFGKPRWGEKTPRHVFRIADMLDAFPDARVVVMVRDPRAVVASYRDWRNQGGFDLETDPGHRETLEADHARARRSYHPVIIALLWKAAASAALQALDQFGKSQIRVQSYEALVTNPEAELRAIADFVSLPFDPAMLETPTLNSSYSAYQQGSGLNRDAIDRWRSKLSEGEIHVVERVCGGMMGRFGHQMMSPGMTLESMRLFAGVPLAVIRAASANQGRISNLPAYIWRRLRLATR